MNRSTTSSDVTYLGTLPQEVLDRVVDSLFVGHDPIVPRYGQEQPGKYGEGYGNLAERHLAYYGPCSGELHIGLQSVLNLSSVDKTLRKRIGPKAFESLVLRSTQRSIANIKTLQNSPLWRDVKTLIFASTHHRNPHYDDDAGDTNDDGESINYGEWTDPDGNVHELCADCFQVQDFDDLEEILSNLPPNLTSLTLDFPTEWQPSPTAHYGDLWFPEYHEREELEQLDLYCMLWTRVVSAVSKNDFMQKAKFDFRLLGVPFYTVTSFTTAPFRRLLNSATSLTLGLACWESDYRACAFELPAIFNEFGHLFWAHLDRVTLCSIIADPSWAIGVGETPCYCPLAISSAHMLNLTHLSVSSIVLHEELVKSLTTQSRIQKLESLVLHDCVAYAEPDLPKWCGQSWGSLFTALSQAKMQRLKSVKVTYSTGRFEELVAILCCLEGELNLADIRDAQRNVSDDYQAFRRYQWSESLLQRRAHLMPPRDQKLLLSYANYDVKYGAMDFQSDFTEEAYLEGADFQQWLELRDLIETDPAYRPAYDASSERTAIRESRSELTDH